MARIAPRMTALAAVATAFALTLSGCASGDDADASPSASDAPATGAAATASPSASAPATPTSGAASGVADPAAFTYTFDNAVPMGTEGTPEITSASTIDASLPAQIRALMPEDARVLVDGYTISQTVLPGGKCRVDVTPSYAPGSFEFLTADAADQPVVVADLFHARPATGAPQDTDTAPGPDTTDDGTWFVQQGRQIVNISACATGTDPAEGLLLVIPGDQRLAGNGNVDLAEIHVSPRGDAGLGIYAVVDATREGDTWVAREPE